MKTKVQTMREFRRHVTLTFLTATSKSRRRKFPFLKDTIIPQFQYPAPPKFLEMHLLHSPSLSVCFQRWLRLALVALLLLGTLLCFCSFSFANALIGFKKS
ncbi:hypothetical protein MANES_03G173850v8 [Manihot esculenta]|uniref:Uncharacterized protein n=4 Tax=Manihot esculenta TaxID=3983 RepID=A0ACB7I192_MANES|nr:hypothetical protein MANES_03G173850v8 [Manihot esculenta]KAG8658671.1 hypothetical protein MANES_03G173850v8 [Manihot esculenta]KAG8658672.1 hypothetical protein MANES_03G173850v8 [Manihot esculenta]KAG8658673.1 hypothetical protein MANES_03G173850v8 [Manihot esculenta]